MGVTSLWTVVHPCARPIKIETLNKKRLAVDASIWIYQFLKAVRDKEGNQLRNSHVVGFFRRVCKLLFIGIKPVFVFDGGAPALKRQTINKRKSRREGRREDAVRTASKLLALQVQRTAEEDERRRREERTKRKNQSKEEAIPENIVYADEVAMTQKERMQNRTFRKSDAYHLPELQMSMAEMGQPNDPRVMSLEELQQYANHFTNGEDINVYDFSKIDYDSTFFQSLPPSDQYNILNAARLRSRLRMGYSKDQLDSMFPDRMAFSKFQIARVKERNDLTQRLIRLLGMNEDGTLTDGVARVAGEKGREYVLVKNDGVEGGWALGVVTSEVGNKDQPINVEEYDKPRKAFYDVDDNEDEEEFEDVPIEGLNRLPKRQPEDYGLVRDLLTATSKRRKDFYQDRREAALRRANRESESLFVEQEPESTIEAEQEAGEEEADLQKAIAMSLQQDHPDSGIEDNDYEEVFAPQKKATASAPILKGSGTTIARAVNARASKTLSKPFQDDSDDDDFVDLQTTISNAQKRSEVPKQNPTPTMTRPPRTGNFPGFDGPLPFEKLDLGSSLFKKKRPEEKEESLAGGFVVETEKQTQDAAPLPPWFSGNEDSSSKRQLDDETVAKAADNGAGVDYLFETRPENHKKSPEVIDLEEPEPPKDFMIIHPDTPLSSEGIEKVHLEESEVTESTKVLVDAPIDSSMPEKSTENDALDQQPPTVNEAAAVDEDDENMEWEDVVIAQDHTLKSPIGSGSSQLESMDPERLQLEHLDDELIKDLELDAEGDHHDDSFQPKVEDEEYTFSDLEDDDLILQLAQEEKEHERFTSSLNNRTVAPNTTDFEKELKQLRNQQKKDRRDADEVTQAMITECQQLLSLFGLPYITAPMEAEAQCAELVRLGLVDGVVTDDSDIFLFGGTRVYKNMFNQAKLVECYLTTDLEAEFGLTRQRLISIAHLLGSDYTEGLPGVGPVTALEILSEFDDLSKFKEWLISVQTGLRTKEEDAKSPFRKKFRKNAAKLSLSGSFPDPRVDEAYLNPEVDSDPSAFAWGVPDLNALRSFLMHTIGWSPERTDDVLVPVIRDMNRKETEGTQSNITQFFQGTTGAGAFAPRQRVTGGSKRLRSALERIGQRDGEGSEQDSQDDEDQDDEEVHDEKAKRRGTKRQRSKKK